VQNTVKAIYGADILATAGWAPERRTGHCVFLPGQVQRSRGAYFEQCGRERLRKAMARWYRNAIENARLCPTAQEYANATADLEAAAMAEPNPRSFVDHLTVLDCSKVSDGASAIAIMSEEGLKRAGIPASAAVEIVAVGQVERTRSSPPIPRGWTRRAAPSSRLRAAHRGGTWRPSKRAAASPSPASSRSSDRPGAGKGPDFVLDGQTAAGGSVQHDGRPRRLGPSNGGDGRPPGGDDLGAADRPRRRPDRHPADCPFGLSVNMGGDDRPRGARVGGDSVVAGAVVSRQRTAGSAS
jgi:acetyl-CoA C-acetyltransferase/acetyl-CoA acyltransferase